MFGIRLSEEIPRLSGGTQNISGTTEVFTEVTAEVQESTNGLIAPVHKSGGRDKTDLLETGILLGHTVFFTDSV